MRVAHVINSLAMGGAERFLLELLTDPTYRVRAQPTLILLNREGARFYGNYDLDFPIVQLDFPGRWRELGPARKCIRDIEDAIHDADLVHTHLWVPDLYGATACRRRSKPHVSHIHNTLEWMTSRRFGFRVRRFLYRRAFRGAGTTFIACSDRASQYQQQHLALPPDLFTTIPYGIDTRKFRVEPRRSPTAGAPIVIGMAGRFVPWKGHHVLIQAIGSLPKGVQERLEFRIAGDGDRRTEVERMAADAGLRNLRFLGAVGDMPRFYADLDALAQPSLSSQGLPLSILESLAAGCVVVASDVAGATEAVTDGVNGLIVPPGQPRALAAALHRLVEMEPADWGRLSAGATQKSQDFERKRISARILDRYDAVSSTGQDGEP